jgi:Flp pilus assembly protein TadD
LRLAPAGTLAPVSCLLLTQALWFSVPAVTLWGLGADLASEHAFFFFVWIGIAHAVQYLWITTYYAAASEGARGRLRYLGKTLLAGAAIYTVPSLLFAPELFGAVPYRLGLFLLVGAAVNLQHFILDGAIWKLRDGRVARILLAEPVAEPAHAAPARGGLRRLVWAVCGASAVVALGGAWADFAVWRPALARQDHASAERVERLLVWLARDHPDFHHRRAQLAFERGDLDEAAAHYRRSLALYPTPSAWIGLANLELARGDAEGALALYERSVAEKPTAGAWLAIAGLREQRGEGQAAIDAYREVLLLDPNHLVALRRSGDYWLTQGRKRRAERLLERAASLAPDDEELLAQLARARS